MLPPTNQAIGPKLANRSSFPPPQIGLHPPPHQQLDLLHTHNQYNHIDHDLDPPSTSTTTPALGLSLPFPLQANINDMDTMFSRKLNRLDATLPTKSNEDFDGVVYGYRPVPGGAGLEYANLSDSSCSNDVERLWRAQPSGFNPNASSR